MALQFILLLKLVLQTEINTMQGKCTKNQENTEQHKFSFYPVIGV